MVILVDQSPCAQYFKRPELKTSGFGARKALLVKLAPTEKTGDLMMLQIQIACWTVKGFKGLGKRYAEGLVGQVLVVVRQESRIGNKGFKLYPPLFRPELVL